VTAARVAPWKAAGVLVVGAAFLAGLGAVAVLVGDVSIRDVAALTILLLVAAATHRWLFSWHILIATTLLVVLFIPIKRYQLPGNFPLDIEAYRIVVAFVITAWVLALIADPRVKLRRTGLEWPIGLFAVACIASIVVNWERVREFRIDGTVVKSLTFFASFILLAYLVVSIANRWAVLDFIVKVLVLGATAVALFAIVEFHTGFNAFDHLGEAVPFLHYSPLSLSAEQLSRAGRLRVYASAQHPIALSAALVLLVPFAIYLARVTGARRWWLAAALLTFGALTTISRTGVLMVVAVILVFLILRPAQTWRLWPVLPIALVLIYITLPNALGSLYSAFFPEQGLLAEQTASLQYNVDASVADNRLADVGPTLEEVSEHPFLGEGFGTRIADLNDVRTNAPILDNQWLGILAETGIVGTAALVLLFVQAIRRLVWGARLDQSPRGWLFVAATASVVAFGVGMFTYDAFGFIQVTLLFFVVLGLSMAGLQLSQACAESLSSRPERGADWRSLPRLLRSGERFPRRLRWSSYRRGS
jgi:O-antigen ligase